MSAPIRHIMPPRQDPPAGSIKVRPKLFNSVILLTAAVLPSCSSTAPTSRQTATGSERSAMRSEPRIMTFTKGFPPPASMAYGIFGVERGCLALKPDATAEWLVAVVPPGSTFVRDAQGNPTGVVLEGRTARFGERIRFGGGVAAYDLGEPGRACPGRTVIVGSIIK